MYCSCLLVQTEANELEGIHKDKKGAHWNNNFNGQVFVVIPLSNI